MAKKLTFRPTVLVEKEGEESGRGLMDRVRLEGLIMQECSKHKIFHSNAFMVASEREGEAGDKYDKVQNDVFFNAYAIICKEECGFCTRESCKDNDAKAAKFLLEEEIREVPNYEGIEHIIPLNIKSQSKQDNIVGIRYVCPSTKLDELAFPVRLYSRKVGALIVGQISTAENRKILEDHVRKQFAEAGKEQNSNVQKMLDRIPIEDEQHLTKMIDRIIETIYSLEEDFKNQYKDRQNQYVLEVSDELIKGFISSVNDIDSVSASLPIVYPAAAQVKYYEEIGVCVREQLDCFCNMIGAVRREIFIPSFENLANNTYDEISGEGKVFCIKKWKDEGSQYIITPDMREKYMPGVTEKFDLLLVADSLTYPIAMALCREDFLEGISEGERELLQQTVCDVFEKFAEFAQMKGMDAKSEYYRIFLDSYMSIQRHELGQSNAGYGMLIEEFRKQRNEFSKGINESVLHVQAEGSVHDFLKGIDNFISDSETYLHTTKVRIQSTKYLIDFSGIRKTYFHPYETFLFKWKQIYEVQVREANLTFHFPVVISEDPDRPLMYGDPLMIEQVAYNLTNNAIKYAIPGTDVSLDCRLNRERRDYEIVVENYGNALKDESETESIFHFGGRGSNNQKEGNGLGLFLTREIAKAHGGEVRCDMKLLSDYNWGLIRLYMDFYEAKDNKVFCKDPELYDTLKIEWEENREAISNCVTNPIPANAFTPMYVQMNIKKPTAKFRFTFRIPYKK